MTRTRLLLAAGAAFAAMTPAAEGAYAPRLEARVEPSAPASPSALVVALRQEAGEAASRTQVVRFPPAFRFNPGFAVVPCSPRQEAEAACPEASRIGALRGDSEFGPFSGPLHLTEDFRFVILVRGLGGLVEQKVEGVLRLAPDGWVETVLDGLPPVRTTFAEVRLEPGARSLILTPRGCGAHPIEGRFTSHEGEVATSRAAVEVAGCEIPPSIVALRARAASRGRLVVGWRLTAPAARAELVLERRVAARPWVRWRRVRSLAAGAAAGPGRSVIARPRGRRLAPGRYRVTLVVTGARGELADLRRTQVTLR